MEQVRATEGTLNTKLFLQITGPVFTRRACATAYSDRSNLLCFFRILITPKNVVLREYFEWNVSHFGRNLYRND